MLPPGPSALDQSWQTFKVGWYLTWPGWVASVIRLFALIYMGQHETTIIPIAFTVIAIGPFARLWTQPSKKFERFEVALVGRDGLRRHSMNNTVAFLVAAHLALLDAAVFVAVWVAWRVIGSPEFQPERMAMRRIVDVPWMTSGFYAFFMMQRRYIGFRFERVPRVP